MQKNSGVPNLVDNQTVTSHLQGALWNQINILHHELKTHAIYSSLVSLHDLQLFMKSHVFAVWDFMSLLKTLQRNLTCVDHPWLPSRDPISARLINEIVLAEESDELPNQKSFASHFELYIQAMMDVGADTQEINTFLHAIRRGICYKEAIATVQIPQVTKDFVLKTMEFCKEPSHIVAAVFLLGREEIIPGMFHGIISKINASDQTKTFSYYLERHTELDADQHAPMGKKLLERLCQHDPQKWQEALQAAIQALEWRKNLWDEIYQFIAIRQYR